MSEELPSVCTLDCPDACALTVTVDQGRVTRVRGSKVNPVTNGAICTKVTRFPEYMASKDRLLTPLKRVGKKGEGRFESISWEQALDTIHSKFSEIMQAHGAEAITPMNYAGPHGMLAGGSMDLRFFNRLGASRLHRIGVCGGVRGEAYRGVLGATVTMRPEHIPHAKLVVVWGNNVTVSNLHLTRFVQQAQRNGAKLVVVDPRRTKIAEKADLHIPLIPGTDVVLAYAIAHELATTGGLDKDFLAENCIGTEDYLAEASRYPASKAAQICGVPESDIRQLAQWYRDLSPAAISMANGLERNRNGGSGCWAVTALPALAGKFGVLGGGILASASGAFPGSGARLTAAHLMQGEPRVLDLAAMGQLLNDPNLDPPILGTFVYNHNPAITLPDQNGVLRGLAREDLFTVVADVVMTDTARFADIVLPNACNLEHEDLYPSYGQHFLQRAKAVAPPPGEALPNTEMFRRLAARFGFDEPEFQATDEQLLDDAVDESDGRMAGMKGSDLKSGEPLSMLYGGEEALLYGSTRPLTPSGKVELRSSKLEANYNLPLPVFQPLTSGYPLTLISPSSNARSNSTFGGMTTSDEVWLEMHPADASSRGLGDGDAVRIFNEEGEIFMPLRVTDSVRPGVISSDKGAWLRTSSNGRTISIFTPTHHADVAQGACYNDARVEVEAARTDAD